MIAASEISAASNPYSIAVAPRRSRISLVSIRASLIHSLSDRYCREVKPRETVSALRKDLTVKCHGRDASRKRKLLDKQKKGKARMREYGSVSIPQEAFIAALRMGEE